jgi:hypothetical protein
MKKIMGLLNMFLVLSVASPGHANTTKVEIYNLELKSWQIERFVTGTEYFTSCRLAFRLEESALLTITKASHQYFYAINHCIIPNEFMSSGKSNIKIELTTYPEVETQKCYIGSYTFKKQVAVLSILENNTYTAYRSESYVVVENKNCKSAPDSGDDY